MTDSIHVVCSGCGQVNRVVTRNLERGPRCGACKRPLFSGRPVQLDEATFTKFIERTDLPVVVDFWAPWCGPCRMMAPEFERAAARLEPHVILAKLNTEEAPQVAARFGIRSIPTLVAFRSGREVARQAGALAGAQIENWVTSHAQ